MPDATFICLPVDKVVLINPAFRRSLGFSRGRIVRMISTVDRVVVAGGYYQVERLDGPEDSRDIAADIHRLTFRVGTKSRLAKHDRIEAQRSGIRP